MMEYSKSLARPFNVTYNPETFSIEVDREIRTRYEGPAASAAK